MHRDSERHKLFSRRAALLIVGKAVLLSGLAARMYYLQVIEAERYRVLAEENRINLRLLAPPRGHIVDRFGVAMADNQQNYRVLLNAEDAPDIEATLDVLGRIIPIGPGERRRILREVKLNRRLVPTTIRENLDWQIVSKIEVNGDGAHPLFQWLRSEQGGLLGNRIKWNFTKFLVGKDGRVIRRYAPQDAPKKLAADIEAALAG